LGRVDGLVGRRNKVLRHGGSEAAGVDGEDSGTPRDNGGGSEVSSLAVEADAQRNRTEGRGGRHDGVDLVLAHVDRNGGNARAFLANVDGHARQSIGEWKRAHLDTLGGPHPAAKGSED